MKRRTVGWLGSRGRILLWPVLAVAVVLGAGACSLFRPGVSSLATPPDPPPLPRPKPVAVPQLQAGKLNPAAVAATRVSSVTVWQAPLAAPSAARVHVVKSGETVYGIARLYGVPLHGIVDANGLAPPYTLGIGQRLVVSQPRGHVVRRGETVYGIARRYGVALADLLRLNRITPPYRIAPGQRLVLPGTRDSRVVAAKPRGEPRSAPASLPEAGGTARVQRAAASNPPAPRASSLRPGPIPKPQPRAGGAFLWPVQGKLILTYGPKKDGLHNDGINIAAPRGAPVRAAENGVVAYAGNELRGFGNLLLIKHADGWMTAYAHNEAVLVQRGQRVRRGQVVARVGDSGNVTAPQLHFEIRKDARAVNPSGLLAPKTAARQS